MICYHRSSGTTGNFLFSLSPTNTVKTLAQKLFFGHLFLFTANKHNELHWRMNDMKLVYDHANFTKLLYIYVGAHPHPWTSLDILWPAGECLALGGELVYNHANHMYKIIICRSVSTSPDGRHCGPRESV